MSASSKSSGSNPFAAAPAVAITATTAQLINIKSHVPVTLDLGDSNFSTWRTFFLIAFRKFGVLDHVDGTRFSNLMLDDAEWTQIDTCIVSWKKISRTSQYPPSVVTAMPINNLHAAVALETRDEKKNELTKKKPGN
ncbi:unnamed protein product [Urochloa humidicola]